MTESFAQILKFGSRNSLGRTNEVIKAVLADRLRLPELYGCLFDDDAWVRMRAADGLEKVCRQQPTWLEPYIDKFLTDFSTHTQPSIQWHMAQIFAKTKLTKEQKDRVIIWLGAMLKTVDVDWIVSANAMQTLTQFTRDGVVNAANTRKILRIQQGHHSKSVQRRAAKLLAGLNATDF